VFPDEDYVDHAALRQEFCAVQYEAERRIRLPARATHGGKKKLTKLGILKRDQLCYARLGRTNAIKRQ
jgi:hypothetical protein